MEISGKFRVTSSRQRAIALRTAKALKIKITLRFVDDRERATGSNIGGLKASSQSLR